MIPPKLLILCVLAEIADAVRTARKHSTQAAMSAALSCTDGNILPDGMVTDVRELRTGILAWQDTEHAVTGSVPAEMSGSLFYRLYKTRGERLLFTCLTGGQNLFV